jgi:hypothetical protein
VPSATATLTATIDPFNTVAELSENNNVSGSANLCWEFRPVPTSCSGQWSWNPNSVGQTATIAVGLRNDADYAASEVKVRFQVSGPGISGTAWLGDVTVPNVSRTCNCPLVATLPTSFLFNEVGTYTFTFTADPGDLYAECNEGNNVLVRTVVIANKPDLRVLSQFISPTLLNPDLNEEVFFNVTYENIGQSNLGSQFALKLLVDEVELATIPNVPGLLTGTSNTVSFPVPYSSNTAGVHIVRAIVDATNVVDELNELNNEATRAIIVGPSANLYFASFAPSNDAPALGETITIQAVIGNEGALQVSAQVQYFYVTTQLDTVLIGTLPATVNGNSSTPLNLDWVVQQTSTILIGRIVNASHVELTYADNEAFASIGQLEVELSATMSCAEAPGSLTAVVTNGFAPFTYIWSNGQVGEILQAGPGTYTLTVTGINGDFVQVTGTIDEDPACVVPSCSLELEALELSTSCDPETGRYSALITFDYAHAPTEGFLVVNGSELPITGSPQTVELLLTEGELVLDVLFSADTNCSLTYATGIVVPECVRDCNYVINGEAYLDNCNTCVGGNTDLSPCTADCNGDYGGTAYFDNCETCVGGETGEEPCTQDCNGDFGGVAYLDNCGTCVGGFTDLSPCAEDCNGDFGGTAYFDNCEICVGGETGEEPCTADCNGDFGGVAYLDNCGICVGGFTDLSPCTEDCNGDFGGVAYLDNCGTCVGGDTGEEPCTADCNGDFGGTAYVDNCETCVGGETGEEPCTVDCNGDFGGTAFIDNCGTCVGGDTAEEPCTADCNGDFGGVAYLDHCGTCVGGDTEEEPCTADCNGDFGGTAFIDNCGTCVGGETGDEPCTQDCIDVWGGSAFLDNCGTCIGGNTGIVPIYATAEVVDADCDAGTFSVVVVVPETGGPLAGAVISWSINGAASLSTTGLNQTTITGIPAGSSITVTVANSESGVCLVELGPFTHSCGGCDVPFSAYGGPDGVVLFGTHYSEPCYTLHGTATGGTPFPGGLYIFQWNGSDPVLATSLDMTVCPTVDTMYLLTVTDANGCITEHQVVVAAFNTDCTGSGSGIKVRICLNGVSICVNSNAAAAILANNPNATLGPCRKSLGGVAPGMAVFPNPNTGAAVMLSLSDVPADVDRIVVTIMDLAGKQLHVEQFATSGGTFLNALVPVVPLAGGMYMVQAAMGEQVLVERLMVAP